MGKSVEGGPGRALYLLGHFGKDAVAIGRGEIQLPADGLDEVPDSGAGGHLELLLRDR